MQRKENKKEYRISEHFFYQFIRYKTIEKAANISYRKFLFIQQYSLNIQT